MKHRKFAHIAIGTAIFATTGAIAWVALLSSPTAAGSGSGVRASDPAAAARKPEHLSEPLVNVVSDSNSSPRAPMTPDHDVPPVFNVSIKAPAPAPHGDFGGGGTGNGIAPLFVANAGPQIGDFSDSGTGGADLRSQVGGGGGRPYSNDGGGPGGGGGTGPSAPPGGDPGGGSGSSSNPSTGGVTTAATMTTSGNLDIAGGFTDVVPTGGNWTVGQDLNVGSSGTASSALSTSGAVKVSGSLNVGNPNGTPATVVIGTTGSIAVSNAVNVYVNSQLQVNGSLTGAQAIKAAIAPHRSLSIMFPLTSVVTGDHAAGVDNPWGHRPL